MLRGLANASGIPDRLAAGVVREQITAAGTWIEELDQLPFSVNVVRDLRRLVRARVRSIQPDT
jgi:hypothetical protein